jgi:hypothetical protein
MRGRPIHPRRDRHHGSVTCSTRRSSFWPPAHFARRRLHSSPGAGFHFIRASIIYLHHLWSVRVHTCRAEREGKTILKQTSSSQVRIFWSLRIVLSCAAFHTWHPCGCQSSRQAKRTLHIMPPYLLRCSFCPSLNRWTEPTEEQPVSRRDNPQGLHDGFLQPGL